ncbi:MAG: hypothetical protein WDW38_004740 [Sanguina aurantia]
MSIRVFDMPVVLATLKKKSKVTKKRLTRRAGDGSDSGSGSDVGSSSSDGVASGNNGALKLYAFIEVPPVIPTDSVISTSVCAYSVGVWHGVLSARGFNACLIPVRRWKSEMGLIKNDKDGSRELAKEIFPGQSEILRRKKDHGRAESLLIAAWALGCRVEASPVTGLLRVRHGPMLPIETSDGYGNPLLYGASQILEAGVLRPKELKPKTVKPTPGSILDDPPVAKVSKPRQTPAARTPVAPTLQEASAPTPPLPSLTFSVAHAAAAAVVVSHTASEGSQVASVSVTAPPPAPAARKPRAKSKTQPPGPPSQPATPGDEGGSVRSASGSSPGMSSSSSYSCDAGSSSNSSNSSSSSSNSSSSSSSSSTSSDPATLRPSTRVPSSPTADETPSKPKPRLRSQRKPAARFNSVEATTHRAQLLQTTHPVPQEAPSERDPVLIPPGFELLVEAGMGTDHERSRTLLVGLC